MPSFLKKCSQKQRYLELDCGLYFSCPLLQLSYMHMEHKGRPEILPQKDE
jgi:hypothetical protein